LIGLARHKFESLAGEVKMIGKNLAKQDIIDVVFMPYQSIIRT
jgi:hypothetical protein